MNRPMLCTGNSNKGLDRVMEPEQFTQVIEAILAGKYSWACVLILRVAGYNPLHYIPYRTYNRIVKENSQSRQTPAAESHQSRNDDLANARAGKQCDRSGLKQFPDLAYLEVLQGEPAKIRGGYFPYWWKS